MSLGFQIDIGLSFDLKANQDHIIHVNYNGLNKPKFKEKHKLRQLGKHSFSFFFNFIWHYLYFMQLGYTSGIEYSLKT